MKLATGCTAAALLVSLGMGAGYASATSAMLAEAKKAGLPAKNCQYCHTEAMPKKDTFKPEALNDRGKFVMADMKQRNLKAPDVAKLKEFPGGVEQK
jgi:hypothetical protein